MVSTDVINAAWEFAGALTMVRAIKVILRDKAVKGIDWTMVLFFTAWGMWNTYFYPNNGLVWSWYGSMFLCAGNLIYFVLLIYYSRKQKQNHGNV